MKNTAFLLQPGGLPLLIQMPILFALYRVIYNIPGYVTGVKNAFMSIVNLITTQSGFVDKLLNFAEAYGLENYDYSGATTESLNRIVDLLYKFNRTDWTEFLNTFPDIAEQVQPLIDRGDSYEFPFWAALIWLKLPGLYRILPGLFRFWLV